MTPSRSARRSTAVGNAAGEGSGLSPLLKADDVAELLRTTRRAVYVAAARAQIPGVVHVGRRLLFRRDAVLAWLGLLEDGNQKRKGKRK